jgi:hypothetical protein
MRFVRRLDWEAEDQCAPLCQQSGTGRRPDKSAKGLQAPRLWTHQTGPYAIGDQPGLLRGATEGQKEPAGNDRQVALPRASIRSKDGV